MIETVIQILELIIIYRLASRFMRKLECEERE